MTQKELMETAEVPRVDVRAARASWAETICLAVVVVASSHAVPYWVSTFLIRRSLISSRAYPGAWLQWAYDGITLAFALLLALPTPRRSGVRIGRVRQHGWQVLVIVGVPIVLTALVYPRLANRPFAGQGASMWVISPLAQDLIFVGYIYGRFEALAPRWLHARVPVNGAVLVTALFFALWHVPNFASITAGYVVFQLVYVFVGAVWTGMTRVLTGSMVYVTMAHMAVNGIAWAAH